MNAYINSKETNMTKKCVDHLGNQYDSVMDMLAAYGISHNAYYGGMRKDIPLERILAGTKGFHPLDAMVGKRYGDLVVKRILPSLDGSAIRRCECVCMRCGKTTICRASSVKSGNTKTCGCAHRKADYKNKIIDGLKVLEQCGNTTNGSAVWDVIDKNGKHKYQTSAQLKAKMAKTQCM